MKNSLSSTSLENRATWAVIVGRFQSPYLHEGHRYLIETALERHPKVLIVLGVSAANPTPRNPMDYETRRRMLESVYGNKIQIASIRDCKEDRVWYQNVEKLVLEYAQGESLCFYGSRDSFLDGYSGAIPSCCVESPKSFNATSLRNSAAQQILDSQDFRAGIIYAVSNRFPQVYPTVDIAIFRDGGRQILLGRKPSEQLFRFPGGFADPTDEDYEAAALREAREECGDLILENLRYLGSRRINDWRYQRSPDAICTLFFAADCKGGTAVAQDDIAELQWFDVDLLKPEQLVEEHRKLWPLAFSR